jgi:hypothetical protein
MVVLPVFSESGGVFLVPDHGIQFFLAEKGILKFQKIQNR